jgi:hypothetical protein
MFINKSKAKSEIERTEVKRLRDDTEVKLVEFKNGRYTSFLPITGYSEENVKELKTLLKKFKRKKAVKK